MRYRMPNLVGQHHRLADIPPGGVVDRPFLNALFSLRKA
jgi:hypothetical protein